MLGESAELPARMTSMLHAGNGTTCAHISTDDSRSHEAEGKLTSSPFAALPPLIYIGPEKTGTTTMLALMRRLHIISKIPWAWEDAVLRGYSAMRHRVAVIFSCGDEGNVTVGGLWICHGMWGWEANSVLDRMMPGAIWMCPQWHNATLENWVRTAMSDDEKLYQASISVYRHA